MSTPFWLGLILIVLFVIACGLLFIFSCDPEGRGSEYAPGTLAAMIVLVILFAVDLVYVLLHRGGGLALAG